MITTRDAAFKPGALVKLHSESRCTYMFLSHSSFSCFPRRRARNQRELESKDLVILIH